jgi:GT2 family glycosyltransferase
VLLLNPDASLAPRSLRRLEEYLHAPGNERVAAVAPRLLGPAGSDERVAWPFPTPGRMWAEAVGLGDLPARQTFVVGAVLLIRWEALQEVGLFDERFFLYAEEADWEHRAAELGWTCVVCPDALARHVGAATSSDPRRREVLFHSAQETYIRKWHGESGWLIYRLAAFTGAAARALVLRGDRRREAGRRARLYLRGPRRSDPDG